MKKLISTLSYLKRAFKAVLYMLFTTVLVYGLNSQTYTLAISIDGSGKVDVDPLKESYNGERVTLTAIADEGWNFHEWKGSTSGKANPRNIVMNENKFIIAEFLEDLEETYTLTVNINGEGSVELDPPGGEYPEGTNVDILALAETGWKFTEWSGDATESDNPLSVTMDEDKTITANFDQITYTLTYGTDGNGTISGEASQTVDHGSNGTQVTAVPNTGYEFHRWSDGVTTAARTETNVTANLSVTAEFTIKTYSLNYGTDGNGTISGEASQTVDHGSNGTQVTAVPNTGYEFHRWSDGVTTAARTETNVTANLSVTAEFTIKTYSLNYGTDGNGTISGEASQTVDHGSNGTQVTAVPNTGYEFHRWSDGVTNASRTETNVTANLSVTAEFTIKTYSLNYSAGTNGTIQGNASQTVNHGGSGTQVTAVPNTGYEFHRWSDGVTTAARTETNVTANLSVTAEFTIKTYSLNYSAGTNGTIQGNASQTVNHGGSGTQVTAVPNTGYEFHRWSDGVTTAARTETNVTANLSVTAEFTIKTYSLNYSAGTNGTIQGNASQTVNHGGSGTQVTAVPNTGYEFHRWSDGVTTAARTETNVTANLSVTAEFTIKTYSLNYSAGTNGTIQGNASQTVNHGGSGTQVTAVPNTGYEFHRWSDGVTTAARTETNVTANLSVTAEFTIKTYSLNYSAGTNGTIQGNASQTVNHGGSGTQVTAVPNTGYEFHRWSDGVTTAARTETNVTANLSVTAEFTIKTYTLTMQTDGTAGASTTPSGATTVNHGASTNISATAPTGYNFSGWTVQSGTATIASPSSASTTVTLTSGNATVRANFTQITYTLTVQTDGTAGASTNPSGETTVNHGQARAISATAPTGYNFSGWTVQSGTATIASPSSASTTVTLTSGNATVRANFTQITYTLTVQTDGTAGASTNPSGETTVNHGQARAISATAPTGYNFSGWTVQSGTATIASPSSASTTVTLTSGNATVRANFTQITYTLTVQTDGTAGASTNPSGETTVNHGQARAISATAPTGYNFSGWTVQSGTATIASPSSASTTVTLTSGNATVRANFTQITYTLTVQTDGTAGASTNPSGETTVNHGQARAISATAPTGYNFSGWTVQSGTATIASPSSASTTVTLTSGNATVRANFTMRTYSIVYQTDGNGTISGEASQTVSHGGSGTQVTAVPNQGYEFRRWSDGLTTASRTETNVTANITVTAEFNIRTFTLTYIAGDNGTIQGTSPQTVNYGSAGSQVRAVPATGYQFVNWSDGVTQNPRTDENVTQNISVTASFTSIPPTATLSGSAAICLGSSATLTITLTGIGPWEVGYTNGTENFTITGINSSPHTFEVSPVTARTYTLTSVKDNYGKAGSLLGSPAIVTIDPPSVGGTITGDLTEIALGQSTGTLTLSGHTGTVITWQRRIGTGSWSDIPGTANNTTYTGTPTSTGTHRYRAVVKSGTCPAVNSEIFEIIVRNSPEITSVDYDALTGRMVLTGRYFNTSREIDVTRFTISNGQNSFTLTNRTNNITPSSSTRATIQAGERDKPFLNWIFNDNGSTSKDNIPYSLTVTENWNGPALVAGTSTFAVFNFLPPSIESATYNRLTAELKVDARRLAALTGQMDIDATKFTITGRGNNSYTLAHSSDVNVLSENSFIIRIEGGDKTAIDDIIDIEGTVSSTGHQYNLAAADRWNRPVHNDYNISDPNNPLEGKDIPNHAPEARNVAITGAAEIGKTVTGSYTYFDLESDPEGESIFAWYRADNASGSGETRIEGAEQMSYKLTLEDAGKFIAFEVTPVAEEGILIGIPVRSQYIRVANSPPQATDADISGTMAVCRVLEATYEYFDAENDPEGETLIRWFRAVNDSGNGEQQVHTGPDYTLALEDEGMFIRAVITPVAQSGTTEGDPVPTPWYGPVENLLPTVSLAGPAEICQGAVSQIVFELSGLAPWTVFYTDGTNQYDVTTTSSPFVLDISRAGNYRVTALVDAEGCQGTELGGEIAVNIVPTIVLGDWYTEIFDSATPLWVSSASSASGSWNFGPPQGDIFTSAPAGGNIWYTDIDPNSPWQSAVTSPCFDFSQSVRPMIAIDLWKEFGQDSDGAVLQYSLDNDNDWKNVGTTGQGINWYNSSQIISMPGGRQTGWTGTGEGSQGWTESRHDLDMVAGKKQVRLRIAYANDGSGESPGGLAFDNVRIGERTRLVLAEHFTNVLDEKSIQANSHLQQIAESNGRDIAYISYHTAFPPGDPLNSQNPADPAARALYYGISTVPFSIMDGGLGGRGRYNYSPAMPSRSALVTRALSDPLFNINVDQDQVNDLLDIEVGISAVSDISGRDLVLYLAVVETKVYAADLGLQGNNIFRNVVRKLLPDAGGTSLPMNWVAGQPQNYTFSWRIGNVIDAEKLALVAFVQDVNTGEIYQVATSAEFGIPTSAEIPVPEITGQQQTVSYYPNPASDYVHIRFTETTREDQILEIYNLSGTLIRSHSLISGDNLYSINTEGLSRGVYIFRIRSGRNIVSTTRIVVMQ
jgi:uncharacterized repeat protein (TIGR02543 family)